MMWWALGRRLFAEYWEPWVAVAFRDHGSALAHQTEDLRSAVFRCNSASVAVTGMRISTVRCSPRFGRGVAGVAVVRLPRQRHSSLKRRAVPREPNATSTRP